MLKALWVLLVLLPLGAPARASEPVAIVYSLAGEASLDAPGVAGRPLRLFDRLPVGTTVDVGKGSRVAMAFGNGRRYELGESSRVTLGSEDLASRTGTVRALPSVPPLPRLSPIAAEDRPGGRAGAVRVRGEEITGLSPDHGVASLATAIRLRFNPVPATPKYRVQIVNPRGDALFRVDTETPEVHVPPGVLAPGKTYHWTVETQDRPGAVARGEALLVVLDAGRARAREDLRLWVQRFGAADDLRLLEGVDRALGLWEEPDDSGAGSAPGERRRDAGRSPGAPGSAALDDGAAVYIWNAGASGPTTTW